jgi:hypothetical protein
MCLGISCTARQCSEFVSVGLSMDDHASVFQEHACLHHPYSGGSIASLAEEVIHG